MHSMIIDKNQMETVSGITQDYPYTMHVTDEPGHFVIPWHWHEEFEIDYIVSGSIRITTESSEYVIRPGEAAFLNSNVLETMVSAEDHVRTYMEVHLFHPCFLGGHFQSIFEKRYLKPVMNNRQIDLLIIRPETERGRTICRMVRDLGRLQSREHVEFQTRNMLSEIWLLLLEEIEEHMKNLPEESVPGRERIRYMLSYIHRCYEEKLTLGVIAASASVSEREALRTFKKILNKTPGEYLTEYRLSKACELLTGTELPVTEIAAATGFADSSYFGKIFRKYYGSTPSQYRKIRLRQQPVPDSSL